MTTMSGVDVSKWQGSINWAAAAPVTGFEMVKATQGTAEVDADYPANIAALRADHEPRGSYHYPDGGDPVAEADFYVAHAGRVEGELQALDFEGVVLSCADPVGWAATWLARVTTMSDNVPLIYMSGSTVTAHDWSRVIAENVGLWCADWNAAAPVAGQWPFCIMWQTGDNSAEPGIAGAVDRDVFFGDAATWARYGANRHHSTTAPPAHPAPAPAPAAHVYTVQPGDTLSGIAAVHGTNVPTLQQLNRTRYPSIVANPNHIVIGWVLIVGGVAAPVRPAPAPAGPATVTVQPNDTLSGIAAAHGLSLQRIEQLNPWLTNPDHIEVGWAIHLR